MHKILFYNNNWSELANETYNQCFKNLCINCVNKGFPCNDAVCYGTINSKLNNHWNLSFYENKIEDYNENDEIDISAGFI